MNVRSVNWTLVGALLTILSGAALLSGCATGLDGETVIGMPESPAWKSSASAKTKAAYYRDNPVSGTSTWRTFSGSKPSIPLEQALAVCRSEARSAASGAERNYRDDNTRVSCRRNWSGGVDCSQSNSATGKGAWAANLAQGLAEKSKGNKASSSALKACMAREGYQN
jgi:hypothetical protein